MDEILQKLLSSELLSEEVKTDISSKWTTAVEQFRQTVREEVSLEVRSELSEQWIAERDTFLEDLDRQVGQKLKEELQELQIDRDSYRDLQAEYAEKIVEEKHSLSQTLEEELDHLVDQLDAFLEMRLTEEFKELHEDIEIVKENEFGREIYEAFAATFNKAHVDNDSVQAQLKAAKAKLAEAQNQIAELEESKADILRESKLEKLLAPLNGKKREQMEFVLSGIPTHKLQEAYSNFIGRILKEEPEVKETSKTVIKESVLVTGEPKVKPVVKEDKYSNLRQLSGIVKSK